MGDDRPNIYQENGVWIFRASALGHCEAALIREGTGITPEPWPQMFLDKFDDGNRLEDQIIEKIKSKGYNIEDNESAAGLTGWRLSEETGQLEIEIPVGSKALVRCHPDGVGLDIAESEKGGLETELFVLEVKALSEAYYKTLKRDGLPEWYKWQLACEMAGMQVGGGPVLKAVYGYGIKTEAVEGEQAELDRVEIIEVPEPPYTIYEIKARVLGLVKRIEAEDIPECVGVQYPCGMYQFHIKDEKKESGGELDLATGLDKETEIKVRHILRDYNMAKINGERAEREKKKQKGRLLELVEELGLNVQQGSFIDMMGVKLLRKKGKKVVDADKVKEKGWDLDEVKTVGEDYWELGKGKDESAK